MMLRITLSLVALVALCADASAIDVYINGTKVTGAVRDQAFQGIDVQFNDRGDVFINASGYTVKALAAGTPSEDQPAATGPSYWIFVNNKQVGHYRVILKVNGSKVGDVASTRRQHQVEITGALRSGKNEIEVVYYPMPDAPKVGELDGTEVLVGNAKEDKGSFTVTNVLGTHKHKTGKVGAESIIIPVETP